MQVGKPVREYIVEPLEMPEPLRPEREPEHVPEPDKEPVFDE